MITRTFKLCLNAGTGSAPYINVSQYDEGETWLFELYSETGERYIPSTGAIVGVKSDGHGIVNTGTVDNEGRVVITETQQMTASAGRAIFELSIDGLTHGTANFIVAVERKPTDDAVMSDSDLSLIQQAVDSAAVIVEVIGDGDPSEVIGEHVDAWLDNHPEATTTVVDGAITAPKLNQSLWDKLLVSESASGNPASFEDGADDVPVSSLKVTLEPIQTGSGDPSPSNVRPIIAANGKNLMDVADRTVSSVSATASTIYTEACTAVLDGDTVTGTVTGRWSKIQFALDTSALVDGATYTWSAYFDNPSGGTVAVSYYDTTWRGTTTSTETKVKLQTTFTYSSANPVIKVSTVINNTSTNTGYVITVSEMQLERGSSVSPFQPYQGIMVDVKGKNLLQNTATSKTVNGVTFTVNDDKSITINGTATARITLIISKFYMKAGNYILSSGTPIPKSSYLNVSVTNAYAASVTNGNTSVPFTVDTDGWINYVRFDLSSGSTWNNVTYYPMIRVADTDSNYEPYQANTYAIDLGDARYGGELDVSTGVLTVDRAYVVFDGSEAWTLQSINSYGIANFGLNTKLSNYKEGTVSAVISDKFKRQITATASTTDEGILVASDGYLYIRINSTTASTVADFKTWLASNNVQCVYDMGTPTTVQLTSQEVKTLLGYNNISSSGTVEVIYHADTKLYIDSLTEPDSDMVADMNIESGKYFIVNNHLYLSTTAIAQGDSIVVGMNCTETNLAEALNALNA